MWLLNCLFAAIPARERVITCEEVFELRVPLPDIVSMQTRQSNLEGTGEIPLRRHAKLKDETASWSRRTVGWLAPLALGAPSGVLR